MPIEVLLDREVLTGLIVGSSCVPILSFVAERFGARVAGVGAGVPATMAASLFFLGLDLGPNAAVRAAEVIPFLEAAFGVYSLAFLWIARHRFWQGLVAAVVAWAVIAAMPLLFGPPSFAMSLLVFALVFVLCAAAARHLPRASNIRAHTKSSPWGRKTFARMAIGGVVVALAVIMGKLAGPVFSALIASFPAVVTATFIALYLSDGPEMSLGFSASVMLQAMGNTVLYAVCVYLTYPTLGVWMGTLMAMLLVSASSTLLLHLQGGIGAVMRQRIQGAN